MSLPVCKRGCVRENVRRKVLQRCVDFEACNKCFLFSVLCDVSDCHHDEVFLLDAQTTQEEYEWGSCYCLLDGSTHKYPNELHVILSFLVFK